MRHPNAVSAGVTLLSATLLATAASIASAQTVPAPSWQVEAGRDTVALRDIARTGKPVDASPVAWTGDGPSVRVEYWRPKGRRLHKFEFTAMQASRFALETPISSIPQSSDDAFNRLELRYEYRRYFFSNVIVRGLDFGGGLQGGGTRSHLTRHFDGDITYTESRIAFRGAIVAAARYRSGSLLGLDVEWANGGHVDRASEGHSVDPASKSTRSGGGWLTDLVVSADVAVSKHASVALRYLRSDEALMSSHRNFTTARRSWTLGVIYAK